MRTTAFSLIELMVVISIIAALTVIAIPLYKNNINQTNISRIVNKLGTYKLQLVDDYLGTGSWSSSINGTSAGSTNADSFFSSAVQFHYNNSGNQAWVGYQLSSALGSGWIFMFLQANQGGVFETHCGAMSSDCVWGYCNSLSYFPSGCNETGLSTTFSISTI